MSSALTAALLARGREGYNARMTWEMIGHEWAVDLLRGHIASSGLRHAYVFVGPDGIGKRTLALRMAQALACTAPPEPGGYCGACRACRLIERAQFPDLHIVELQPGESQITIDQVRELQRGLSLAPYEGRWRVAVLLDLHAANDEAQNALLKTLEEPPPRVVLVVTARSAEALLPTIVSRCEVIPLRGLPTAVLRQELEQRGEAPEAARLIAALSGGRPGAALGLHADSDRMARRRQALDDLTRLLAASRAERFVYIDGLVGRKSPKGDLDAKRRRAVELLETWLSLWRDAILAGYKARVEPSNPDRTSDVARMLATVGPAEAAAFARAIERTIETIGRYANLQLALETLMLDLPTGRA